MHSVTPIIVTAWEKSPKTFVDFFVEVLLFKFIEKNVFYSLMLHIIYVKYVVIIYYKIYIN